LIYRNAVQFERRHIFCEKLTLVKEGVMLRRFMIAIATVAALGISFGATSTSAAPHGHGGGGGYHGGGGHGGGYRGGWGGGGWGWGGGWGPYWGPDYYYNEPGDCGWVRVRVLRNHHWVVRRAWRCW
jgi:hypothetical protein